MVLTRQSPEATVEPFFVPRFNIKIEFEAMQRT